MSRQRTLIQVAVGIVVNNTRCVLMTQRLAHKPEGGKWEFPGGKLETGETVAQALVRELKEEVAIEVLTSEPWLRLEYAYPNQTIVLNVCLVTQFTGHAWGKERQALRWLSFADLAFVDMPAANREILAKLVNLF